MHALLMAMCIGMVALSCPEEAEQSIWALCPISEKPAMDLYGHFRFNRDSIPARTHAFPAWGPDAQLGRKTWFTFGWMWLQRNSSGHAIIDATPTEVTVQLNIWNDILKESFLWDAARKYPDQNTTVADIQLMPNVSFSCACTDTKCNVTRLTPESFSVTCPRPEGDGVYFDYLQKINECGLGKGLYCHCIARSEWSGRVVCDNPALHNDVVEDMEYLRRSITHPLDPDITNLSTVKCI